MSFLDPHDWSFPVPIRYGPGRLREIAGTCRALGITRPLIVTDRGSAHLPFIETMARDLASDGREALLFHDISPNPCDHEIAEGRLAFRDGLHDGVIAIGGGSGMDGGKAIALTAMNEINLWAFEFEQDPPEMANEAAFPPLICIPTTAGTGAETDSTAMITDTERLMKWCVWHPDLKPARVILDPALTVGLPRNLTAWTGLDALVHAIEAYSVPDTHPMCDAMALEGLRLVWRWLPVTLDEPENLEARGAMLTGSCMAGIGFQKGLGLVHAISHMLGAEFDTQHGLTNAVMLPYVLRFNAEAITEKIAPMTQVMELPAKSFDDFHSAICALLDDLDIPNALTGIDVPEDCAARIAKKALQDSAAGTNPRRLTARDIEGVVTAALHGRRK